MESCWGVSSPNPAIMKNGKQHDLGHALPVFCYAVLLAHPLGGTFLLRVIHRCGSKAAVGILSGKRRKTKAPELSGAFLRVLSLFDFFFLRFLFLLVASGYILNPFAGKNTENTGHRFENIARPQAQIYQPDRPMKHQTGYPAQGH